MATAATAGPCAVRPCGRGRSGIDASAAAVATIVQVHAE